MKRKLPLWADTSIIFISLSGTQLRPHLIVSAEYKDFTFSSTFFILPISTPIRNRTWNLRIRSALLYPIELWRQICWGRATWFISAEPLGMSYIVCSSIATLCDYYSYDAGTTSKASNSLPLLYYGWDSNPHEHYCSGDFKSPMYTVPSP